KAIGCTSVQVFTSSPQQWKSKPVDDAMVSDFQKALKETGIESVVCHDSYLINLASVEDDLREKSIAGLSAELGRCATYGIPYVVSHIGAYKGQEIGTALARACDGIHQVLENTDSRVTLLMETTDGQGSALNSRFEEIATILDHLKRPERLAICL